MHLTPVLGGMWQIMFIQGGKSFSFKKHFKRIRGDLYNNVTCTHSHSEELSQAEKKLPEV